MRKKLINMIYILFIILSIIFMLKIVYLQANEFIVYQSYERLTGSLIASIISILMCIISFTISIKNLIANKGR